MKFLHCSVGLALYALLAVGCETTSSNCDPAATAGSTMCQSSQCSGTMSDCKNGAADGCETDTARDVDNCGACGNKCPTPANGEASCTDGICGVSTCGTRYKDCNATSTDGCEIDSYRDASNCGACGNVCPGGANATGVCIQGKCQLACQAAYLDCNSDATDGCETNGASDLTHCGNCGNTCTPVGATNAACSSGSCISTMCTGTSRTCKAGPIDSCEINTGTDVANCGACGKQCAAVANGTPGCAASNCMIASCNANFADCDSALANGCEINTTNNVSHCGMCGKACAAVANGTPGCTASTCGIASCNVNFADCDKALGNGCEINTSSNNSHCGMCGNVCGAGKSCIAGKCVIPSRVLIVHASSYIADVQTKLQATGAFTLVDLFDARGTTPTLAQLQNYDVVLPVSDGSFNNPTALGDVLANYWDAGGRVVMATFANASVKVAGRWETGGYHMIAPLGQEQPSEKGAIQILVANHPLMAGVTTMTADAAYRSTGGPINGGVVIANWGSGKPLVVAGTRGGRNLVSLNFYPPSSTIRADFWVGDGATLMKNALQY